MFPERSARRHVNFSGGAMTTQELARHYLEQGKTLRAAGLMINLVETEPTSENLELLADVFLRQGLLDDAKELYLRIVTEGLKRSD